MFYVVFKINLHAKSVSFKKPKMSLHSWATMSGTLQACMCTDFLYTSKNASLSRGGPWSLTAQGEDVSKGGM